MCEKCGSNCLCDWLSPKAAKLIQALVPLEKRAQCATEVVKLKAMTKTNDNGEIEGLASDDEIYLFIKYYSVEDEDVKRKVSKKDKVALLWARLVLYASSFLDSNEVDMNEADEKVGAQWKDYFQYLDSGAHYNHYMKQFDIEKIMTKATGDRYKERMNEMTTGEATGKCICGPNLLDILKEIPKILSPWPLGRLINFAKQTISPIALDLDGDGVESMGPDSSSVMFDFDGEFYVFKDPKLELNNPYRFISFFKLS